MISSVSKAVCYVSSRVIPPVIVQVMSPMQPISSSLPAWLEETFLGYGNPAAVDTVSELNLYDTFLNREHAEDSMQTSFGRKRDDNTVVGPEYSKWTVPTLKAELVDERHLSGTGKKAELIARLLEDDVKRLETQPSEKEEMSSYYVLTAAESAEDDASSDGNDGSRKRKRGGFDPYKPGLRIVPVPPSSPYLHECRKRNEIEYSHSQVPAIIQSTMPGLTLIRGNASSGKSTVLAQILANLYREEPEGRSLVLCKSENVLENLVEGLDRLDVKKIHLLRLYALWENSPDVELVTTRKTELLAEVSRLAKVFGLEGDHGASCETAAYFYTTVVSPKLALIETNLSDALQVFFSNRPRDESISGHDYILACKAYIQNLFAELADVRPIELLRSGKSREQFLLTKLSKIVFMSVEYAVTHRQELVDANINFSSIMLHQANVINEVDSMVPFTFIKDATSVRRLVMLADPCQLRPTPSTIESVRRSSNADQSLFDRLVRSGVYPIHMYFAYNNSQTVRQLCKHRYPASEARELSQANAGFAHVAQFIDVPDYNGRGESSPRTNDWQNLGEAEYVVALYQYMRLLDYPAEKITILTPYAGQKALIQEVLDTRCRRVPVFSVPQVATVEEYLGQKNDFVLLSLVRTSSNTDLQDKNMMTTALTRGRWGVYVFGRAAAMPSALARFTEALNMSDGGPLELVTGEMYPTSRMEGKLVETDTLQKAVMAGVEHLGKYVYEMTQKKLESMNR